MIELVDGFENLDPYLIGTPRQFYIDQGEVYCLRKVCQDCPYLDQGCEIEKEDQIQSDPIPHPRRAIGYEEDSFLILRFKEGQSFETLPKELWDNPYLDKSLYESNLHFILTDPKSIFKVIKGQIRYCGDKQSFEDSPYSEFFDIFDEYIPQHKIAALDYSSIEPKCSTIVANEPAWIEIFKGIPKIVVKEIFIKEELPLPSYVEKIDGKLICFLEGELDKENFEAQCGECNIKEQCNIEREIVKNVAGDWHSLNALGLYQDQFINGDKYEKKRLRTIAKVVGLALNYGGSAWTVSNNMNETVDEAQDKIDNFFRKLSTLQFYMNATKRRVMETGQVSNLFGRIRDMSKWAFSQDPDQKQRRRDAGYAQRTALNHPIQSTCAELLKISMIRVDEWIQEKGYNPLSGKSIPKSFDLTKISYRDFKIGELNSVHDEVVYMMHDDLFDNLICDVYEIMQTKDVIKAFDCDFDLELDCEFDSFRSWTSQEAYLGSKIFFTNNCKNGDIAKIPNTYLIEFEDLTSKILDLLNKQEEIGTFKVAVKTVEGEIFIHEKLFPESFIEELGISFKLANIKE